MRDWVGGTVHPQLGQIGMEGQATTRFSEKYLRKNGPGAASAQGRKSKFDTMRPMNGYEKSPTFMALGQTVFDTDQKNHKGADSTPTSIRVK